MRITLADLDPAKRHAWLTPLVAPRPIAFVSTMSAAGVANVAPYSFFALGGGNPPSLAVCATADRDGNPKDTLRNIRETGEFVVNIVSRAMAEAVNQASAPFPPEVDEFEAVGLSKLPSVRVRPWRVGESPASIECRVFTMVEHGRGPQSSTWIIGEALELHVDDGCLADDGLPDTAKVHPAARMGRQEWAHVDASNMFVLVRPTTVPPGGPPPKRHTRGL